MIDIQYLWLPRQGGKTARLMQRVAELQDEGYDPVVVVVPAEQWCNHWASMLVKHEVDPSRVILYTEDMIKHGKLRGFSYALAGFDDADMFRNFKQTLTESLPSARNDTVLVTYSYPENM